MDNEAVIRNISYEKTENGQAATNALLTGSGHSARLAFWPDVNRSYDATDQMMAVRTMQAHLAVRTN
jgi:hypothetical protein